MKNSTGPSPPPSTWSPGARRAAGALCLLLAAGSVGHYMWDVRLRSPADRFVRRFSLDRRHPLEIAAMRSEPSADLAVSVAVDAALLEDAPRVSGAAPASSSGARPAADQREEFSEARELMLRAMAVRPGWPLHPYLLGRTQFLLSDAGDSAGRDQLWADPLRESAVAAPGADLIASTRGAFYLEKWRELPANLRAEAPEVLRRALVEPTFVAREFAAVIRALGAQEAVRLLPDTTPGLQAAVRPLSRTGDAASAAVLYERLLRAHRMGRASTIQFIERRDRLGDVEGKRDGCLHWFEEHSVHDFDDAVGRAEAARLLELWPNDVGGSWASDPRAELVGFFLNGRENDVKGEALERAVEALGGVPPSVRGRVKLLSGDESGALEIPQEGDPLERQSFFLELAKYRLRHGRPGDAREALERLSSAAVEDCDALMVRRDVARALGEPVEAESLKQRLEVLAPGSRRDSWSAEGYSSLCLDPARTAGRRLGVVVQSDAPALVAYGWDDVRSGVILLSRGEEVIRVPLGNVAGRRNLFLKALVGGPIRPAKAYLEPVS